jgi:ribulose-bisphosphate carboxylase large chain
MLRVTYLIRAPATEIAARAEALMLEQAVELPRSAVTDSRVTQQVLGCVESIEPVDDESFRVVISHPLATAGSDPAQLLNVLFGNSSLQPDVVLADIDLPDEAFDWLPGPRAGIDGVRTLTAVSQRPLLATALKPMGLETDQLASLCLTFARAGVDIVKDDHGLANQTFAPFEQRVAACLQAVETAAQETGRRTLYVPNLIGSPGLVARQLAFARDAGAQAVMIAPMLVGLPLLHQLASAAEGVPIFAHPAFGGVLRAGEPVLFGKVFRWFGADAVVFPHAGGRFRYTLETCRDLASALRAQSVVRPAFPVPGGGVALDRVADLLTFYGRDCILLIGSGLYEARDALLERTRAVVQQVANVSEGLVA